MLSELSKHLKKTGKGRNQKKKTKLLGSKRLEKKAAADTQKKAAADTQA
jgi:hypothetical protein